MTKFSSHLGLTLAELVISTAVVGIIMVGVMSSDYAIRKHSDYAMQSSAATIKGQSIIAHVMNKAFMATGDQADPGFIVIDADSFCIRSGASFTCYTRTGGSLFTCNLGGVDECELGDPGYENLGEVSSIAPQVSFDNSVGSQSMIFTFTVGVPDSSSPGGIKTSSSSVSPPGHRI